jgi:transposase
MKTYSMDLRERVLRAYDQQTGTQTQVAARFGVSVPWIKKLLRRRRETGSAAPKPHGGGWTPRFSGPKLERLQALVLKDRDATLQELLDRSGVAASIMAVQRALLRLGWRLKKSRSAPPSRTGRTCKPDARPGGSRRLAWTRAAWSSSTRAGPRPI